MSATEPRGPRVGLTLKIFGATAVVVILALGGALVLTGLSAHQAAKASLDRQLSTAGSVVQRFLESEQDKLAAGLATDVQNPNYAADLAGGSAASFLDRATTFKEDLHADYVYVTDAQGIRRARSDAGVDSTDLSGSPLVASALRGAATDGYAVQGDAPNERLYLLALAPIRAGVTGQLLGVVAAARQVTDSVARLIKEETGSDAVFYVIDGDRKNVVASSVPRDADLEQVMDGVDAGRLASANGGGARMEAPWRGNQMVGFTRAIANHGSPAPLGGYVVLRSLDAELAPFVALQRTLYGVAIAGLLLALLASLAVATRIARPVRALVSATHAVAEGDMTASIPEGSNDEIGDLAVSFKRMLEELKAKQELVDFLGGSVSGEETQKIWVPGTGTALPTMTRTVAGSVGTLKPGQTLAGRYEIRSILGTGGMGVVYRANDRELGEAVAIKTLKSDAMSADPALVQRFKDEIRLARKISHRNVVRTHDLGEVDGMYYITMEFAEGQSLKHVIQAKGSLPVPVVLTVGKQLCRALEAAHEQGVIHRDIKPQNLIVEPSGTLKVMDFGIARLATRTDGVTQAGMAIGTPEYMAPEQLLGDEVDFRADLYAAGCVLFECLTGRPPFVADSPITLVAKQLEEMPPSPASLNAEVPEPLARVVLGALAKDKAQRPANAGVLYAQLDAIAA